MDLSNKLKTWKRNSKNIAKRNTNYDTGNLVNNAIKTYNIKSGFVVMWDESNAYYIKFVNDGTKHNRAFNFVGRTANDIKDMIEENRDSLQFVDRPSKQTLQRREKRQREAQEIWKRRTYNIADRTTRFRRGR